MNAKVLLAVAVGTLVGLLVAPRASRTVQAAVPIDTRFQMYSATISNTGGLDHEEFLLDTQTGQIWRYNPTVVPSNGLVEPEVFVPVPIAKATK